MSTEASNYNMYATIPDVCEFDTDNWICTIPDPTYFEDDPHASQDFEFTNTSACGDNRYVRLKLDGTEVCELCNENQFKLSFSGESSVVGKEH